MKKYLIGLLISALAFLLVDLWYSKGNDKQPDSTEPQSKLEDCELLVMKQFENTTPDDNIQDLSNEINSCYQRAGKQVFEDEGQSAPELAIKRALIGP